MIQVEAAKRDIEKTMLKFYPEEDVELGSNSGGENRFLASQCTILEGIGY